MLNFRGKLLARRMCSFIRANCRASWLKGTVKWLSRRCASSNRRSSTKTHSWESRRFLLASSRLFIVTLSYATLAAGNPSGSTNGQRTPVSVLWEPVFRMRVRLQFFRRIFIANPFDRSTKRVSRWSLPDHPSLGHSWLPPFSLPSPCSLAAS